MKKIYAFFLCLLLSSVPVLLKAQDSYYWTSNFSPAGFLTPGAAIANTRDSGIVYLNPAVMAWSDKTATSISSNVYRYDHFRIKNGVGMGKDLVANSTRIVPQLVSKTFKLNKQDPLTIGFALIQNPLQDFNTSQRLDKKANVLNDSYSPGDEVYIGQYDADSKVTETYAQISVGKRISQKLAAGLTLEGTLRNASNNSNITSRALYNTPNDPDVIFPPVASNQIITSSDYTYAGVRLKFGLAYDSGNHHWGLLLSSPLAKLYSRATFIADINSTNLTDPETGVVSNLLASTRQTNLRAKWKMPLSLAGGYAYDYGRGQIYLAAEFFGSVNSYTILKPEEDSFIRTGNGSKLPLDGALNMLDGRKKVLNVGIGYSREINEVFTLMSSLRTDFNYLNEKTDEQGHISLWDNYHAQIGGNFKRRKFNLRAGLLLSYGRTGSFSQQVNFDGASDKNQLIGESLQVPAKYISTGLLLSYIHNF
ncbi:hypothetical protein TH53_21480 [Pedobacter lusitanus]|uniref:Long-chain fatty acid transport protein n=1 Tax=Pedobacter lusitanus TaxID=1503925 RepID=A0A0D0GLJ9_9SPHI|nr:hypothetical protein [Pedobacter lusitanus]KIO75276.1 hypothetical protein TH53_21480 [Pedobacter lusitanus]